MGLDPGANVIKHFRRNFPTYRRHLKIKLRRYANIEANYDNFFKIIEPGAGPRVKDHIRASLWKALPLPGPVS
jgi:hypothetical protein